MLTVWTLEVTIQAFGCRMHHQESSLHLFLTTLSAFHHLEVTDITGVLLSHPQFSLPVTTLLRVGALHLEATKSSAIEEVWKCGEGHTVNRANLCLFNARSTE